MESLFQLRFGREDSDLVQSIKEHGIISPLLVVKRSDKSTIVDGSYRFKLAQELNLKHLPLLPLNASLPDATLFRLAVEANAWSRGFNLIEKSLVANEGCKYFSPADCMKFFQKMLAINHRNQLKDLLKLAQLPLNIKQLLVEKNFPLAVATKFFHFENLVLESLHKMLAKYAPSQSDWSQLLDTLFELEKICEKPAPILLEECVVTAEKRSQGLEHIKLALKLKRYPRYEGKKSAFDRLIRELKLPTGVQLMASPYFENGSLELKARLHNAKDKDLLLKSLGAGDWEKLFAALD